MKLLVGLLVVVILGLGQGLYQWWARQQRIRLALQPECLLCGGGEVDEREDGYGCRSCGFDTNWEDDPTLRETIELFRSLTIARNELITAKQLYGEEARLKRSNARLAQEAGDRAENCEMTALDVLQRAADLDPTLLETFEIGPRNFAANLAHVDDLRGTVETLIRAGRG